jgi:WD40 repeat protein
MVSAGADGAVRLWDAATGQELRTLTGHTGPVRAVGFSSDGTRIVSAGYDRAVRLWDPASGQPQAILIGLPDRWATILPNGMYKLVGDPADHFLADTPKRPLRSRRTRRTHPVDQTAPGHLPLSEPNP